MGSASPQSGSTSFGRARRFAPCWRETSAGRPMIDLFETTQVPDDLEYWDALAGRVAASARSRPNRSGFHWLGTSRGWAVASLLLAVMWTCVLLSAQGSSAGTRRDWAQALAPPD